MLYGASIYFSAYVTSICKSDNANILQCIFKLDNTILFICLSICAHNNPSSWWGTRFLHSHPNLQVCLWRQSIFPPFLFNTLQRISIQGCNCYCNYCNCFVAEWTDPLWFTLHQPQSNTSNFPLLNHVKRLRFKILFSKDSQKKTSSTNSIWAGWMTGSAWPSIRFNLLYIVTCRQRCMVYQYYPAIKTVVLKSAQCFN